mmetsp:Transcript_14878/g.26338  ORF Transcript_14878/g.26338 Transcript_14878/m.26338 type:complete len:341 (+) Transcript_14878:418-1440(+)
MGGCLSGTRVLQQNLAPLPLQPSVLRVSGLQAVYQLHVQVGVSFRGATPDAARLRHRPDRRAALVAVVHEVRVSCGLHGLRLHVVARGVDDLHYLHPRFDTLLQTSKAGGDLGVHLFRVLPLPQSGQHQSAVHRRQRRLCARRRRGLGPRNVLHVAADGEHRRLLQNVARVEGAANFRAHQDVCPRNEVPSVHRVALVHYLVDGVESLHSVSGDVFAADGHLQLPHARFHRLPLIYERQAVPVRRLAVSRLQRTRGSKVLQRADPVELATVEDTQVHLHLGAAGAHGAGGKKQRLVALPVAVAQRAANAVGEQDGAHERDARDALHHARQTVRVLTVAVA